MLLDSDRQYFLANFALKPFDVVLEGVFMNETLYLVVKPLAEAMQMQPLARP